MLLGFSPGPAAAPDGEATGPAGAAHSIVGGEAVASTDVVVPRVHGPRRRRAWLAATAAIALVAVGAGAYLHLRRPLPPAPAEVVRARQAVEASPRNAAARIKLAWTLVNLNGPMAECEEHSRQAVRLEPASSPAHLGLGFALHRQGRIEEAEAVVRRAVEFAPQVWKPRLNLGIIWMNRKKYGEAWKELAVGFRGISKSPAVNTHVGFLLADCGLLDRGEKLLRTALELEPGNAEARKFLAELLETRRTYTEAETKHRAALAGDPALAAAHHGLGRALGGQGRWDEAAAAYLMREALWRYPHRGDRRGA